MINCKTVFLDLDGVLIDSLPETYAVSTDVFFGSFVGEPGPRYKELFYRYRGIVGPPEHFYLLHSVIVEMTGSGDPSSLDSVKKKFSQALEKTPDSVLQTFKEHFLERRLELQVNLTDWFSMNPVTKYGSFLAGKNLQNFVLNTTKNQDAALLILEHYDIRITECLTNLDFVKAGSKGALIHDYMVRFPNEAGAIFVDDMDEHLHSVKTSGVECYFASWGYGDSSAFPEFSSELWHLGIAS